eukprot:g15118.t1
MKSTAMQSVLKKAPASMKSAASKGAHDPKKKAKHNPKGDEESSRNKRLEEQEAITNTSDQCYATGLQDCYASLRPWQQRISDSLDKVHAGGGRRALVHAVTGAGKSRLIHYRTLKELKNGTLVVLVTSRLLLIEQLSEDMCGNKLGAQWGKLFDRCHLHQFCSLENKKQGGRSAPGVEMSAAYL